MKLGTFLATAAITAGFGMGAHLDVRTIQAEDEIAAMGATIGAAYGGAFAATGTSGPGLCLKSEAINLAVMLEIPLVILDVQRGGPSTGLPTKTEQTDLLQAILAHPLIHSVDAAEQAMDELLALQAEWLPQFQRSKHD